MMMKYFTGELFLFNRLFALMAFLVAIEGSQLEEMIDGGVNREQYLQAAIDAINAGT